MRATKKTLLGLTGALAACIAAVLLLTFTGNGREAEDHAHTYYFTTYDSPEDLVLASVENSTGSVVLAASGGTYYTVGDLKLSADGAQVQSFFETVYKLPMKRLLDEADASDPQYGLTDPQAEILIQQKAESSFGWAAPRQMAKDIMRVSVEIHGCSSWIRPMEPFF